MKILKNKRGAALETAILFLIIIYSFCLLISMTSALGARRSRTEKIRNEILLEREQLTEDFLAYAANPEGADSFLAYSGNKYEGYGMQETADGDGILLTLTKNGEEVLYLCAERTAEGVVLRYCKTSL